MNKGEKKTVLFYRKFRRLTGGHLKVWHYFNHVKASSNFAPRVYLTEDSARDQSNPWWQNCPSEIAKSWAPDDADVLFIGGMDWRALPTELLQSNRTPIINIVQGFSHADPQNTKFEFLKNPAIRICVNPLLREALLRIPDVNGPVISIPMGLDIEALPEPNRERFDVAIAALKAPKLGAEIAARLKCDSRRIKLLTKRLPRNEYLQIIADSRVAVLLPLPREGFYLPMLEAMAMRRIAVCPDCVANRAYCISGQNGFLTEYAADAIEVAVESALGLSDTETGRVTGNAAKTAASYTLQREQDAFLDVLSNVHDLWISKYEN